MKFDMLQALHTNICNEILLNILEIQTCSSYPMMRSEPASARSIVAPACFVEISGFDVGTDPGTEELAVVANFEARIVMDRIVENAQFIIRELALKLANLINHNTWNSTGSTVVSPAKIKEISQDAFSPELDAYLVWNIGWTHELHVGANVWTTSGILPHKIIVNGEDLS
jgi:hypothetical protein